MSFPEIDMRHDLAAIFPYLDEFSRNLPGSYGKIFLFKTYQKELY